MGHELEGSLQSEDGKHEFSKAHPSVNPNPSEGINSSISVGAVTDAFVLDQMQAGQIAIPVVPFKHFVPQMGSSGFEGQAQQGGHQKLSPDTKRALDGYTGSSNDNIRRQ